MRKKAKIPFSTSTSYLHLTIPAPAEIVLLRKTTKFDDSVALMGARPAYPAFQIPYRCLLPKKVDHVLAAGRCIGAPDTIESFRLIAPCFVTGEAAGTAAALCAKNGCAPRQLDVKLLQKTLTDHNVCLA